MKATTEPEKITALYLTAQYGLVDIAKLLLTQGRFILPELIYIQAATGNLALDIACSEGHTQVVELLLNADSTKQSVFEPTNPFGFTPLCYAAKNDHHEVIDKILWSLNDEMRTKLLYSTNKNGYNPLMAAVINGSTNAIKILLTHIDKLEICRFDFFRIRTTSEQATVLYMAAGFGRADVVDLLFQELTDEQIQELLAITNCNGLSPFNVAVRKGHILVVVKFLHYSKENKERLIKSQSTINGFTALHFAAQYGQVLAARLLLSQVNDKQELLKTQDHCDDLTPFGLAVMMGQTDMVQELLKYGIELSDILNAINNIFRIKDFSNIYLSHDSIIDAHDEFESRLDSYKENRVAIAKVLLNHLLRGSFLTVERTVSLMEAIHLHLTFAALTSIENQDNDFLLVLIKEFFTAQEINAIFTTFFYAQVFSRMPNSWTITQFISNKTTRAQTLEFIYNYHPQIYSLIKQPEIKALILVVIKVFNFAPHHEFQVDDLIKTTKFDGVFSDREDVKTLIATTNPEIMILFEEFFKPAVKQFLPIDQTTRIRRLNALARVLSLDPKITTWVCIAVRLTTDPSGNIRFHIAVNSPMDISKDKRFFQPGSDSKIDVFKKLYALMQDKDLLLNIIKSNFIFKNGVPKSLESSINIVDLHDPTILYTLVERHIEQNYEAQLQKLRANLILSSESRDEKIKQTEITCSSAIKKAHDAIKKCLEIDIANVGNYLYLINEELFNKKHTSGSGITLAEAEQMVLVKIDELEKSKSKKSAEILEAARDLTIQEKHITETQSLIQARIDWLYALAYNQEFCAEILTECSLSIAEQQSTQSAKLTTLVESLIQPLQHVHTLERINTLRARTRRDLKKIILSMRGYDYYEDGNSEIRTLGARNFLQKRNRNTQHSHAEPTASVEIAQTNIKRHCELEIARKSILLIYIQNLFDLIIKHRSEHDLEDKFTAGQKATLEIIRVGLMPSSDPLATNFLALQEKFEQCSADDFHSISYNMLSTITILNELRQQPENKTIAIGISFKCCPKCSYELSDCGVPVYEQHTNTCPTTGIFDDVLLTDGLNPGAEFHDLSVSTYSTTKLFVTGQPQSIARFSGFLRPPAMVSTASEHSQELSPLASDRLRF